MKHYFWHGWGIAARLLAIVVLPAAIMFMAVTATIYFTARNDVRRDVSDRGRLIATALAQSSQYGLVSGNTGYLRPTLRHMLEADPSIACIDITNDAHEPVVSDCQNPKPRVTDTFDIPITLEPTPNLDLFEPSPINGRTPPPAATELRRTIGHVRVTMSPAPVFAAKLRALGVAFLVVLGAAVVSCFVGLRLAQRLRHTLGAVLSALRLIRQGQFKVQLDTDQAGELGELQRTIVQMADNLHAARHELEQQVATRTQELQEAVKHARRADAEKRRLIVHSNAAVEEERKRIAVDIHDHLGGDLISVRLEASGLAARAKSLGDASMEHDARRIAKAVDAIYSTTRNIVKRLRPEIIDTLGLSGAIEELVRNIDQVAPACKFNFRAANDLPDLRGKQAMPAYRVAQEAMTNIVKHSGATQASVELRLYPDAQHLNLIIRDNGKGFDPHSGHDGIGLIGMRERVAAVGGTLHIESAPGEGTEISVTLPL
jgi:two-component system, NarL family, sensor histidine kinase UhpB